MGESVKELRIAWPEFTLLALKENIEAIHKKWHELAEIQPNQKKDPEAWAAWDLKMKMEVRLPSIQLHQEAIKMLQASYIQSEERNRL